MLHLRIFHPDGTFQHSQTQIFHIWLGLLRPLYIKAELSNVITLLPGRKAIASKWCMNYVLF